MTPPLACWSSHRPSALFHPPQQGIGLGQLCDCPRWVHALRLCELQRQAQRCQRRRQPCAGGGAEDWGCFELHWCRKRESLPLPLFPCTHPIASPRNRAGDGTNDNFSWNCGVEGETNDPGVTALRARQMRNFHLALMLSQGTPMILAGGFRGSSHSGRLHGRQGALLSSCQGAWLRGPARMPALRCVDGLLPGCRRMTAGVDARLQATSTGRRGTATTTTTATTRR